MSSLLRRRNFALLWLGGLLSFTGDWVLFTGLPLVVFDLTGSTLSTAGVFAAAMVPRILWGSLAGVLVDRWDRRKTLVATSLVQAVALLPLLLVHSEQQLWIVYAVAFVQASLEELATPAEGALLPRLVPEEDLVAANALNSLNNNLARLVGPVLAGFTVVAAGLGGIALLDAVSFLCAAGLIAAIAVDGRAAPAAQADVGEAVTGFWRQWREGIRLFRRTRVATVVLTVAALTGLGEGVLIAIFVPFVVNTLEGGEVGYGLVLSSQAVGGLLGGVLIARFARSASPARLLGVGAIAIGLIDVLIFTYPLVIPGITLALVLFVIVGLPVAAYSAGLGALRQTAVEDAFRGRLIGAYGATLALSILIGTLAGGALGEVLDLLPLLLVQSAVYTLAGVVVLVSLTRGKPASGA